MTAIDDRTGPGQVATVPGQRAAAVPTTEPRSRFRTDIEGLRAVAVLLVVANHLLTGVSGGFIGVDVFFVISGFLISGLLISEGERRGRISIREFYARRVRRILPAALLVLAATVVVARFVTTASRAHQTLTDAFWSSVFLANVHFNDVGTDYFAQGSPPSALQHYWSLSVEEQFYVVWPLTLLVLFLVGRRWLRVPTRALIGVLATLTIAVSFLYCVQLTSSSPTNAYFSTPARAWELGLGALLAVNRDRLLRLPVILRSAAAWIGLAGIGVAAFVITESTPFPGYAAALPVVATGLVLAAGNPGGGPGRTVVLGNPVVQYVGALSYSLYLWHFPAIVLSAAYWGDSGFAYYLCAAAVPAILAVLSFHLMENPIRQSKWLSAKPVGYRRPTFRDWYRDNKRGLDIALIGITASAFLIAGALEVGRSSAPTDAAAAPQSATHAPTQAATPLTSEQSRVLAALSATSWGTLSPSLDHLPDAVAPEWDRCINTDARNLTRCSFGSGPRTAVVLGDSVAVSWVPGLRDALTSSGWRIQLLTYGECPAPMLATARSTKTRGTEFAKCTEHRQWALDQVRRIRPDLVLISSQPTFAQRIVGIETSDAPANYAAWQRGLTETLHAVQPYTDATTVLAAPPKSGNLQICATRRGTPSQCVAGISANWLGVSAAERAAARSTGARYVDTRDWFCYAGKCPAVIGTTPVMWDGAHITAAWSRALAPELKAALLSDQ